MLNSQKKLVTWLRILLRNTWLVEYYYQPWSYVVKTGVFLLTTMIPARSISSSLVVLTFQFRRSITVVVINDNGECVMAHQQVDCLGHLPSQSLSALVNVTCASVTPRDTINKLLVTVMILLLVHQCRWNATQPDV